MQFLNGVNPMMIKRCSEIPPNFPVTEQMVEPFLEKGSSLRQEIKVHQKNQSGWTWTQTSLSTGDKLWFWGFVFFYFYH